MAKARKDTKGRVLRKGETLRKDGLYTYKYTDPFGKKKYLYSKDLAKLREKEAVLIKNQVDGLDIYLMGKATLNFVYDRYIKTKTGLRQTTREGYNYTYNHYVRETFGKRLIADIKYSDILYFYEYLMDEEELSYSVVDNVHTVLHPTFGLAVKDDIIRKNLSDGVLGEIKKNLGKNSGIRHALTRDQQRVFVGLLDLPENAKWKPVITFLLGTGCRVGECIGIRWQDVDFEGRMISINHSVSYLSRRGGGKGKSGFCVFEPKTRAGKRTIPLLETVRDALIEYKSIEEALGSPRDLIVDGMSGFIFLNRFGNLYTLQSINVTANLN